MGQSGIDGRRACPRGLRHAFGIGTLQAGIPLNVTQKWMGHASLTTTAIYAEASGPEEIGFAEQFWRSNDDNRPSNPRSFVVPHSI
jgi:integrase/recombinase XerD